MDVDQQFPEQVEEYTDDQGRRVRRIVRKTVIRTTGLVPGETGEEEEPTERVEEFIDDQGRKVRRVIKHVVRKTRVEKQVEPLEAGLESQPFKLEMRPKTVAKEPEEVCSLFDSTYGF